METEREIKPQGIGARVLRKEDDRHLHGRGQFVSDMVLPGQMEVAFLRSPIAHGHLRATTKPAGREADVYVMADLAGVAPIVAQSAIPGYKVSEQYPLAQGKVRFVGEPIAFAVAGTRAQAEDLLEEIDVELDDLPALVDADAARADNAPRVHDDWSDNLFMTLNFNRHFAEQSQLADVVVEREIALSRQAMVPMEGKAVLAYWDMRAHQLVVYTSTQVPHMIRIGLAEVLPLAESQIRVVAPDVGGGFGYKCVLQPEEVCVAWLALTHKRPFRWVEDRREHLVTGANTRQHHYKLKAFADKRGRLLALDAQITIDNGAYSNWPFTAGAEPGQAVGNLPGPYVLGGYRCTAYCVATNKPAFVPYRGVARTGVCFAIELMIDAVAREVGREPYDVRYENLVPAAFMPYDNVTGKHYDSGDYQKSLAIAREKLDLDRWREMQGRGEPDGRLIGVGFATYCEQTAHGASVLAAWGIPIIPGFDQANVRLDPDGGLEIRVGIQSHGQGLETTLAQVAHEVLGVDLARIRVVHGDTGITPFSTGTYASRSIVMAGGAVSGACEILAERIKSIGSHLMQCSTSTVRIEDGRVVGPLSSVPLSEIAAVWHRRPDRLPPDVDSAGLEVTAGYKPKVDTGAFSYGTHAVAVAVDPELGTVEILDYVIVEDCGRVVNPMVVDGQTIGGATQGIGTALYEESLYDANGQPLTSTLADYLLPGAAEVPKFRIFHLETLSPYTAYGIKGVGEGGAIAPPAALCNAVNDALRSRGVEIARTPITPSRILAALQAGRQSVPTAPLDAAVEHS